MSLLSIVSAIDKTVSGMLSGGSQSAKAVSTQNTAGNILRGRGSGKKTSGGTKGSDSENNSVSKSDPRTSNPRSSGGPGAPVGSPGGGAGGADDSGGSGSASGTGSSGGNNRGTPAYRDYGDNGTFNYRIYSRLSALKGKGGPGKYPLLPEEYAEIAKSIKIMYPSKTPEDFGFFMVVPPPPPEMLKRKYFYIDSYRPGRPSHRYLYPSDDFDIPLSPPFANLSNNIEFAKSLSLLQFKNMVDSGQPWDYKQYDREFADFGNYNYGATGAAAGILLNILLRMAGWVQMHSGNYDPAWGVPWGFPPYGDDPNDQLWIQRGYSYYKNYYKKNI